MVIVDGIEFLTKEEAVERCRAYVSEHTGTTFHNYAHSKVVRRPTTAEERTAAQQCGQSVYVSVTVHEWDKLYTDSRILREHPELKGMWRRGARP